MYTSQQHFCGRPGPKRKQALWVLAVLGLLAVPLAVSCAENWPQFRGPTGLGYTEEKGLPAKWGGATKENVLWTSPLVGQGHASPVVWGDSVFVCTVRWAPNVTARDKVIPDHHVLCYQAATGKLQWDTVVPPGPWLRNDFRSGPGGGYAAPTPVTDGKLVYSVFGSAVMAALDFQGKIVWRKEIVPYSFDVTIGSSPILYEDTLILFCAMAKASDSQVVAFDKSNGELKWRQKFPDMAFGHSTPVLIRVKDQPQMLVLASGMGVAANGLRSLNPADGKVIWWCRAGGDASSPAFGAGLVYCDSGRGGPGVAVDPTGAGDVSKTNIRWTVNQVPEAIGSPIIVGDYVYRLHSPGILKCWETATGKQRYSERLADLSSTWASPIADPNGRLYFATAGKSYVIQSGPDFRVLAVNDLGDASHPSLAAAKDRLFLVGQKNLYCVGTQK
jgi:outer membrane protein assembly factor BamB